MTLCAKRKEQLSFTHNPHSQFLCLPTIMKSHSVRTSKTICDEGFSVANCVINIPSHKLTILMGACYFVITSITTVNFEIQKGGINFAFVNFNKTYCTGKKPMIIDFFFDTICPWSYVGKRRLEQVLAKRKNQNIRVNFCSLLLNPDLPPSGIDRKSYLSNKFRTESHIQRVYGNINDVGLSLNIDFNFNTIRHTPNTIDTHRLIHFAEVEGKSEIALDLLFKYYFVEGKNIGNARELMVIANKIGIDTNAFSNHLKSTNGIAEIYATNARAHSLGINGMPSYVFNGRLVLSGAQEPNVLARMIDAASASDEA